MIITKQNINQFIDGTVLDCSGKYITNIEYIPEGITRLSCVYNQLTSLPKLPESLIELYCWNNKLTSLPKLPEGLSGLFCGNNNLPYEITINNIKEHNRLINRSTIINTICESHTK